MSGTGVITVDAELRVGGVQETITVTGETPVVDVQSTKREVTLDNETMRSASERPQLQLSARPRCPGCRRTTTTSTPVRCSRIFPIHGGRGVESRLTVDGLNISNPPGGNQPPNFTADIGNAAGSDDDHVGRPRRVETAGLTMNIVPQAGRQQPLGPGVRVRLLGRDAVGQLHRRTAGARRHAADAVYSRLRRQHSVGGPIVRDRLWYYMSVRVQGQRQNTLNIYYNKNAGNANAWTLRARISAKPAFSDRTWENYTPRITWQAIAAQQDHRSRGTSSRSAASARARRRSPARRTSSSRPRPRRMATASSARSASSRRGGRRRSPTGCCSRPASAPPTTSGAARSSIPNPTHDLVQVVNFTQTVSPGASRRRCATARRTG